MRKKLIPIGVSSGVELMERLTTACSPTLFEMEVIQLMGQLQNPHRKLSETPKEYLFHLQDLQQTLFHQNITVDISPLAFVKGLVVYKQLLRDDTIAYKKEIDHLQQYGHWPQTWAPHKSVLLDLVMQINRDHEKMSFKPAFAPGNNDGRGNGGGRGNQNNGHDANYQRKNSVTEYTSMAHCRDFYSTLQQSPETFFTTGWGKTLLDNTDQGLCIFHGTQHGTGGCNTLQPFS